MSVDSYSDYYQLCYNGDTTLPTKEKDYNCNVDGTFPFENYISSPKSYHRHIYHNEQDIHDDKENIYPDESCPVSPGSALYSDLNSMKTMLQSSYLSEKLKKDNEKNCDKFSVEEAVSCLESLLSGGEEETYFKFPDVTKKTSVDSSDKSSSSSDSAYSSGSGSLTDTLNVGVICELDDKNCTADNNNIDPLLSLEEQYSSDTHKIQFDTIDMDHVRNCLGEDSSSSGVSSKSDSPSTSTNLLNSPPCLSETNSRLLSPSKSSKLNVEIDRLKNITIKYSPEINKRHSMPKIINDIVCEDINLLESKCKSGSCNSNNSSSTSNGRKSPFLDLFKTKRSLDYDTSSYLKQKGKKGSKCLSRSNSALLCNFKKTQTTSTIKNNSKYVNLTEKQDPENRVEDDIHNDMKIQHASPFVRTIFQYVESTSVEDIFSSSNFNINDNNSIPMFTSSGMRNLQENKFNSLSRKVKKNGIIRTLERGQHEPTLIPSGRRISENSDFYISVIAYLDRIRKAKVVSSVSQKRRPRARRHKSDPGDSISMFLSQQKNQLKLKRINNSSEELHDVGQGNAASSVNKCDKLGSLSTRFSNIELSLESKHFKSPFSSSDSAIPNRLLLCEDSADHRQSFSRKSKSLKNISSYASRKKGFLSGQAKQDSFDSNRLSVCDDDNEIKKNQCSETAQLSDKLQHARRELFPDTHKNPMQRRSVFSENFDIQKLLPHRRSVFSENFDTNWRHSLSTSSPSEIQCMLDTHELSPDNRQLLTELLLHQLTQMGPSNKDQEGNINQDKYASSTDDLITTNIKRCENNNNDCVLKQNLIGDNQDTNYVHNDPINADYNRSEETDERNTKFSSNQNREKDYIKHSKSRKLFGSMRKNKTKLIDWEQVQYMNVGYDDDSMSRKGKGIDTKQHPSNPKVKRFSAIRSIFEPITSPKAKKPWKLDRIRLRGSNTSMKKNQTYKGNCGEDILRNENMESGPPDITSNNMECNTEVKVPFGDLYKTSIDDHDSEDISITSSLESENYLSCYKNTQQHKQRNMNVNKPTFRTFENNFGRKLFRKSKSTDSISCYAKINTCHRISLSRSVDDIHELKKCTRFAAALFQDINDSGILHGSNSLVDAMTCRSPRKDVIEVYIGNGHAKSGEDLDEGVTAADSEEVGCLKEFCEQCRASSQDVENSRIVVDVPHHLIPPEIASKSPHQSPNVRRKGLLKKSPCVIQRSLSNGENGEKGRDFTSADSGLSLSDETDYTQSYYEKDNTNFCIVKEPKHNTLTVNLKHPIGSTCKHSLHKSDACKHTSLHKTDSFKTTSSFHKTELYHHVDKHKLSDANTNIPHVISYSRSRMCDTVVCKRDSNHVCVTNHGENICSSESSVNTTTVRHHSHGEPNFSISNIRKENNEVELEFKTPSNNTVSVAELVPDDVQACDDENNTNSNSGEVSGLTRKPSVIWAIVKKMEVSLVIQKDYGDPDIIKIEDFNVRRVNTYKDVEELAVDTFTKHLQLLDKQHLDLDSYDIKYLQMAEHRVPLGSPFDLSLVKIEDSFLPCRLCMKDKESWSLASLSYDSLIPKSYLEKYVSLILSHHHGVFFGPSGTGKSYLAERISNLINYRMNEGTIPPIILKNATPERWKTLLSNLRTEKKEKPFVIILDGFSQRFIDSDIDIGDIIKICDEMDPKPYVICTLTVTPNIEIPPKWQLSFKWIWLSNHEEPVDGLLQRYLRRKFIQYGNQHLQREFFRIADWLTSVWRHINTFLKKYTSSDCSIGPTMFYDCPSDILEAEEWFVDLWNYSITPYIISTVKQGLKLHGARCEWEDPLTYILKSYPWVSEKMKRKIKLKRISMEDVDYSLHCHSEEEKQRLLDFLRQLEIMMFAKVDQRKQTISKGYTMESSL